MRPTLVLLISSVLIAARPGMAQETPGKSEAAPQGVGSFVFTKGELVGADVSDSPVPISSQSKSILHSTEMRALAKRPVREGKSVGTMPAIPFSDELASKFGLREGDLIQPGTYRLQTADKSRSCQLIIDDNGNVKATFGAGMSTDFKIARMSSGRVLISCVMGRGSIPGFSTMADEGPGTVHGCFCYNECDANGQHCHRVCSCWNDP